MSIDSSNGDEFPASPATLLSHEEVRPQVVGQRRTSLSRVAAYRRKLRRQRNRRLSLIVAVTIACVASGLSYIANHPEFKIQNYIPKETLDVGPVDDYLEQVALKMKKSLAKLSQLSKAKKNSDPSTEQVPDETETKNEAEVEEEAETIGFFSEEEVVTSEAPEEDTDEDDNTYSVEGGENTIEEEKEEEEETHINEEEPMAQTEDIKEETKQDENLDNVRPGYCNIPLAYLLHRKCRRLASQNPVFNLHGLVHDMIQ